MYKESLVKEMESVKFEYCLYGFKTFKQNAKDIFDIKDVLALIALTFSLGILFSKALSKLSREVKAILAFFSLLAALPAIIKTIIAVLAGISEAKRGYTRLLSD